MPCCASLRQGLKKLAPILTEALSSEDKTVRQRAAQVLGDTPAAGALAIHALVKALDEEDEFVRLTVLNTLNNLGTAAAPATSALVKILANSQDIIERGFAADVLGPSARPLERPFHSCSIASRSQGIVRPGFISSSR